MMSKNVDLRTVCKIPAFDCTELLNVSTGSKCNVDLYRCESFEAAEFFLSGTGSQNIYEKSEKCETLGTKGEVLQLRTKVVDESLSFDNNNNKTCSSEVSDTDKLSRSSFNSDSTFNYFTTTSATTTKSVLSQAESDFVDGKGDLKASKPKDLSLNLNSQKSFLLFSNLTSSDFLNHFQLDDSFDANSNLYTRSQSKDTAQISQQTIEPTAGDLSFLPSFSAFDIEELGTTKVVAPKDQDLINSYKPQRKSAETYNQFTTFVAPLRRTRSQSRAARNRSLQKCAKGYPDCVSEGKRYGFCSDRISDPDNHQLEGNTSKKQKLMHEQQQGEEEEQPEAEEKPPVQEHYYGFEQQFMMHQQPIQQIPQELNMDLPKIVQHDIRLSSLSPLPTPGQKRSSSKSPAGTSSSSNSKTSRKSRQSRSKSQSISARKQTSMSSEATLPSFKSEIVPTKTGVRKRRKNEWTHEQVCLLLNVTKLLINYELKAISQALFELIKRDPGKCKGRAAEKKLKRMGIFDNWKTADKTQVLINIDSELRKLEQKFHMSNEKMEEIISVVEKIKTQHSVVPQAQSVYTSFSSHGVKDEKVVKEEETDVTASLLLSLSRSPPKTGNENE